MIIDGRAITREILTSVRSEVSQLGRTPVVRAITVQPGAATESYLGVKSRRAKASGMQLEIVRLSDTATTDDVLQALLAPGADALLVQLPLPSSIDTKRVLDAIPPEKDADVLSLTAHRLFEEGSSGALLPPVVGAVAEVLARAGVSVAGKKTIVVGKGWLVGEPCAAWLTMQGAEVSILTRESGESVLTSLGDADIVVSGAGSPGLIRPEYLKPGVVLIDAGTSESDGSIVGDADPACADVASVFTPVPGGVGPIAVACLFKNAGILATRATLHRGQ